MDDSAVREWAQKELQAHVAHVYKAGLIDGKVRAEVAWALPGKVCLSRVGRKDRAPKSAFWVISDGRIVDHVERKVAKTPRLAVRHFSMKWQLNAARLDGAAAADMARQAEALYALTEEDGHWVS